MDFQARRRIRGSHRRGSALILAALVAALTMAITSPAQATPNIAKAWGANNEGQLGDGTTTGPEKCGPSKNRACSTTPVAVTGLSGVTALAAGPVNPFSSRGFALLEGGTVMQWGSHIGDVPTAVCAVGTANETECPAGPFLERATAISAGEAHALALLSSGEVVAWGDNFSGQLGDGGGGNSTAPVPVCAVGATAPCSEESKQLKAIAIAAGGSFSLALLSNDTVVAWGNGSYGQRGDGTNGATTVPVPACAVGATAPCSEESKQLKAIAIAAGFRHSMALLEGGTVAAWGDGAFGELGNGTETTVNSVPVHVSGLTEVTAIAAGMNHDLALLKGTTVEAWGSNESGQLGDGTNSGPEPCGINGSCSKTPVAVCSGSHPGSCPGPGEQLGGVSAIAAGGSHSLALVGGRVKTWGANSEGQLGDGTSEGPEACTGLEPVCSATPVEVSKRGGYAKAIAGGGNFSLAVVEPPPAGPLPELGRCVEAKGLTGEFKNHFCVSPGKGHGRDNWLPGPGEKKKFEGTGSATTLQTAKHKIICSTTIIDGEYLTAKTATATVILKGCINAATKATCQSNPANTGEIETTQPLEGELGFIKGGTTPSVGLDLKKSSVAPNVASFSCGGPPQPEFLATVEGSVIAPLKPIDIMVQEFTLTYNVTTAGKQVPERFEGGVRDTLGISFAKGAEKPVEEEAGLKTTVTISNQEPLEIKAK